MELPDGDIKPTVSSKDLELGERFGIKTQT